MEECWPKRDEFGQSLTSTRTSSSRAQFVSVSPMEVYKHCVLDGDWIFFRLLVEIPQAPSKCYVLESMDQITP